YVGWRNARFLDTIHSFAGAQTHSVSLSAPQCVITSAESKLILRSSALLLKLAQSLLDGFGIVRTRGSWFCGIQVSACGCAILFGPIDLSHLVIRVKVIRDHREYSV